MSDLEQRLAKLQKQFHDLRIMGGEGVIVHGSPSRGYAVEIRTAAADSSGSGGGGTGPTPTGACCIGASCSVLTAADCATMGGTYQGDGASCSPNPCACPEISLVCDQICSSLTKCGFQRGSDPIHYYLHAERVWSVDITCTGCGGTSNNGRNISSGDLVYTIDPVNCVTSCVGSSDDYVCCPDGDPDCSTFHDSTCSSWCPTDPSSCNQLCTFDWCFAAATLGGIYTCDSSGSDLTTEITSMVCSGSASGTGTSTTTYSDENTTTTLISNTEAALPAYDGIYDDTCAASRELPTDESTYSICRFKPKFTFAPSPINFTLTYNEHFVPDVGSPSDTMRTLSVSFGDTEALGPEVLEPSTNGSITITDIVCTPV